VLQRPQWLVDEVRCHLSLSSSVCNAPQERQRQEEAAAASKKAGSGFYWGVMRIFVNNWVQRKGARLFKRGAVFQLLPRVQSSRDALTALL
jgi:hypothetical protein